MWSLANPTRFMEFSGRLLPWLVGATLVVGAIAIALVWRSPDDYLQGVTVKIMHIHVPAAWLALMGYTLVAISSLGVLIWRHPLAEVSAKAAAPIGATFTLQALITGALWGKPTWGTYWQWDARMTSVLVLFLLYLGLIALWNAIEDKARAGRMAAILALVGFVNVPIIKFSVDWWTTLHQPASVFRLDGPTIHSSLLVPLLVSALAFTLLFVTLHVMVMRNEILARRLAGLNLKAAWRATAATTAEAPTLARGADPA